MLNAKEGVFFGGGGRNKRVFQLKREVHTLARHFTCPIIHEVNAFHFSDVPLVRETKNST